jgi:DNA-directed RNA polymerase specialized sigma24 family protein
LEKLPEHYYHILCLTDYLGYPVKQASVLLGINEDNAYKRLQRARIKLTELLKEEGIYNV